MADSMGLPYSMGLHGSFFPDMKCLGEDIRFAIAAAATNLDALGRRESFLETRTRTRTSGTYGIGNSIGFNLLWQAVSQQREGMKETSRQREVDEISRGEILFMADP